MTEVEPDPESASNPSPQDPRAPSPPNPQAVPFDPQAILASLSAAGLSMSDLSIPDLSGLSITDMEANVGAMMESRMSQLDEMLNGLDQLVARVEAEMTRFEDQADPPQ